MSLSNRKSPSSDPNLIPRVKQYLEENVHKTYVDVEEMTQSLMNRYQEYSRRKMIPFRIMVEHAYKTVLHSYGLDSNPGSDVDDMGSDLEVMDDANNGNHLNNALNSLYMKKTNNPVVTSSDPKPISIDISSDEEDGENSKQKSSGSNVDKVTVTRIAANGSKTASSTEELQNIIKSTSRPGPASQKKRRLNAIEELEKQTATPSSSTTPVQQSTTQQAPTTQQSLPSQQSSGPKPKKFRKEVFAKKSLVTFDNIGGMDKALKELCELVMHIKHPEMYRHIGLPPPRGFLLHGPPGSGKTLLAHAIAGQLDVLFVEVPATELIAGVSGESEERIREIFEQAASFAPCVLFIDEIDAISSNRQNAQKDMERRIVAQLISSLDNLSKLKFGDQVLVIGATNRPDSLDPALRRVGRFDHEVSLGIPDRKARSEILKVISGSLKLERPFDYDEIALLTPGYVGADLLALATRAASTAIKRAITKREEQILLDEIANKKEAEKETEELVVEPIVNLDDDLLMEVDNEVDKTEEKTPSDENKADDTNEAKKDEEKSTEDKPAEEPPKETESNLPESTSEDVPTETMETVESSVSTDEKPTETEKMETAPTSTEEVPFIMPEFTLDHMIKWLQNDVQPISDEDLEKLAISRDDFLDALKHVQPSAKREGFITVPDVTWDNIGSLKDIRSELQLAILAPVKFPEKLQQLGLESPSGVLLCGPPGCGKTLLAKAVANEAGINFISVKGPELLNMYVGESERAVRQCFHRARNSAPCVIFFDEFDSLCPKRSDSGDNNSSQRVVNQLLTEMDGVEDRKGVFLMAATNRPDIIDPAVLRPGRLDKILYVGLPETEDRIDILKALTRVKPPLADDVDLVNISCMTEGFTGADLDGLIRQASLQTLQESIDANGSIKDIKVHNRHFVDALKKLKPSVNEHERKNYEKLKEKYGIS
ncbi:nuclear valosin-containing protein-like isoform X1 [Chironomus tepperi]|uniref:nuclear valosin-containing protein-like isoform X1 n=1 Tax=Chironomus tepperi TaxID=113505 RepID=UPI00391F2D3B